MATTRTNSAGKASFGSWESEEREHPQGCSFFCALSSARRFCRPKGLLFYFSRTVRECALRGIVSFSKENIPLTPPRERTRGLTPRPRTLAAFGSKSYTRCALHSRWQLCCLTDVAYPLRVIRCGVRGFATSLCESVHSATAPYYREARVTVVGRQTACGRGIAALAALFSLLLGGSC